MRFQDAFFTTQGERKRQRTPNSRFQNDYVALPGLRTTAKSTWEQRSHKGKWTHGEGSLTNECTELTEGEEERLCCVSVWLRVSTLGSTSTSTARARTAAPVQRSEEVTQGNGGFGSRGCACTFFTGDWLVRRAGEELWLDSYRAGEHSCLELSHPSGNINVTYNCHIDLFEINSFWFFFFSFVNEKLEGRFF